MNCIFCHNDLSRATTEMVGTNSNNCKKCKVIYLIRDNQIAYVAFYSHTDYRIDLCLKNNTTTLYSAVGAKSIITIHNLYWIFPDTQEHWVDRLKGMLAFI